MRQRSRGMTATGSHKDFEFAARSTTLQGKPFAPPVLRIEVGRWPWPPPRGGCHAVKRDWGSVLSNQAHSLRLGLRRATSLWEEGKRLCKPLVPTAPHPSRAVARATFPQGKALLRRTNALLLGEGNFSPHRGGFLHLLFSLHFSLELSSPDKREK